MSALTTDREGAKRRIEDLKKELREAEMQIAVEESSDTLLTVSGDEGGSGTRLGLSVFAEISVNGIPTRTLIDTGSPATIISLQFVMTVMVAEKKDGQTREQWKADTLKKLASPEVSIWWTFIEYHRTNPFAPLPREICC